MKKTLILIMIVGVCVLAANATPLSIYEIQYTDDISGDSIYDGDIVDCAGGIVINKWYGGSVKLTIYDPANSTGWGGIIAKAYEGEFNNINIGEWVSFTDILVEERSGNTQLSYGENSAITVVSYNNTLPEAIAITDSAFSEQYESMKVKVNAVEITETGLGRYGDNYNLHNETGDFWAGDYMNTDAGGPYHWLVAIGNEFESVSGFIEHKISGDFDYYQMLTTSTSDFVVPEPAMIALLATGTILLRKRQNA